MTKLRTHRLVTLAPAHSRDAGSSEKLSLPAMVCIVVLFCAAAVIAAPAQGPFFTTLHVFDEADGSYPTGTLVQASDGNLYGTTFQEGAYGYGTVFKITPSGTLTTLYNFGGTDGAGPSGALVQASDENFYGTTSVGGLGNNCGSNGCGTFFSMTPSGMLTTLYSFCSQTACTDGGYPSGLVQATDGDFYGTTDGGGANGFGTVFKITPTGELTTLYNFCPGGYPCADGMQASGVVQATDGNFYGTTNGGGAYGNGTVFKINASGTLTSLYSFCSQPHCPDGTDPGAALVQASDGDFYGTTTAGGVGQGWGTVFKITAAGTLTTLHRFGVGDGADPAAALMQATDGNLYGTTYLGGAYGYAYGTVFKMTPAGTVTTLHSFNGYDGYRPVAGLAQASDGYFYGTTTLGGEYLSGTVFRVGVVHACAACRP